MAKDGERYIKKSEGSPERLRRAIRYKVIDELKDNYSVLLLCNYLKVSRSGYYNWIKNGRKMFKCFDEILANLIQDIFSQTKKGYRFITNQLRRWWGLIVNRKTVLRYMNILGIKSPIRKSKFENCTQQDINKKSRIVCENFLDRKFEASRPLEKLVTDVSYIYHKSGRLYLSVIKDLYDNSILAYSISKWNSNELVMNNLNQVFGSNWNKTMFCILHSDQGFQYTCLQYIKYLDELGITVSHSRKANCLDNACCENFFSHLKSESLELDIPNDEEDLIKRVDEFIIWYNTDRPQDKLKGMTPYEFRSAFQYN